MRKANKISTIVILLMAVSIFLTADLFAQSDKKVSSIKRMWRRLIKKEIVPEEKAETEEKKSLGEPTEKVQLPSQPPEVITPPKIPSPPRVYTPPRPPAQPSRPPSPGGQPGGVPRR